MLPLMLSIARSAFSFWECKGTPSFHGGKNKTSFPVEIHATSMAKCDKSPKMYKKVSQNKIRTGDTCMIKNRDKPYGLSRWVQRKDSPLYRKITLL